MPLRNNIDTGLGGGRCIHVLAIGGGNIHYLLWLSCISKKGVPDPDLSGYIRFYVLSFSVKCMWSSFVVCSREAIVCTAKFLYFFCLVL